MKKYTKKEIEKTLDIVREAMEGEGDVVVVTDKVRVVKGNPVGVMANICGVMSTIKDTDVLGKIVVTAGINAIKDELVEPTEDEKEEAVEDLVEMLIDAVKNK